MSNRKLDLSGLFAKRPPLSTGYADRVYSSGVDNRFVKKRREAENKRAELKVKNDLDYPSEREL